MYQLHKVTLDSSIAYFPFAAVTSNKHINKNSVRAPLFDVRSCAITIIIIIHGHGACAAFSNAYLIMLITMARLHRILV